MQVVDQAVCVRFMGYLDTCTEVKYLPDIRIFFMHMLKATKILMVGTSLILDTG